MKEGDINCKFLRVQGIAGIRWMDGPTYDCFAELLDGPFTARAMLSMTEDVDTACCWDGQSIFAGLEQGPTDK